MEVQSWTKGSRIAGKNSKRRTESQPNCHRVSFTLLTEGRAGVMVVGVGALGGANVGADLKGEVNAQPSASVARSMRINQAPATRAIRIFFSLDTAL